MENSEQSANKDLPLNAIFQCVRCGSCCQGETTVSLDEDDQRRMVTEIGLERDEVARRYWRVTGKVVQMKTVDGHCIFFREGEGCAVHQGRPWRCGQWPLHPSMLDDRANFETIRASCPGINQEIAYEDFCRIFRRLLQPVGRLLC